MQGEAASGPTEPFLLQRKNSACTAPLYQEESVSALVLQATEEAPGFMMEQGPLVVISLMLLKVGSTIFLPNGGKGKI